MWHRWSEMNWILCDRLRSCTQITLSNAIIPTCPLARTPFNSPFAIVWSAINAAHALHAKLYFSVAFRKRFYVYVANALRRKIKYINVSDRLWPFSVSVNCFISSLIRQYSSNWFGSELYERWKSANKIRVQKFFQRLRRKQQLQFTIKIVCKNKMRKIVWMYEVWPLDRMTVDFYNSESFRCYSLNGEQDRRSLATINSSHERKQMMSF